MADKNSEKYSGLDKLCRDAKSQGLDLIVIHHPQVLGDNYEELIENLEKIAQGGLAVRIVPQSERKTKR